ncbi:ATP-grasp domain-containing protein [Streptomyces sp. NPDC003717]|uniref:ATP-grasp domain-containing protein n=1 Tax=Streptomyces sp. NPDC003717 TaxID=3154276 RepID=UPI00339EF4E9
MTRHHPHPPVVLVGARPAEGHATLTRLGVPFLWIVDPSEPLPQAGPGVLAVHRVPYRDDPTSLLEVPLPRDTAAVLSFTEFGLLPAALLSEALGLPSVSVGAVLRTRDKLVMRRALQATCPGPAFGIVGEDEPDPDDFPLIAKPVRGAGSRGVRYLAGPADHLAGRDELRGLLWERFVSGPEYSVEAVSGPDGHRVLGVTAKRTSGRPRFIETGHESPAPLDPRVRDRVEEQVRRCLDALGVDRGATHTEVKIEDGRVHVIETHTRAGGDRIPLLTRLVTGLDQYELAVRSVLPGVAAAEEPLPRFAHAAVHYFPWEDAVLDGLTDPDRCRGLDGVVELEVHARPGDHLPVWQHSHERPGHVVVGADTRDELHARVRAVEEALNPVLRPLSDPASAAPPPLLPAS